MTGSALSEIADDVIGSGSRQIRERAGHLLSGTGVAAGVVVLLTVAGAFLPTAVTDLGLNEYVSGATVTIETPRGRVAELGPLMGTMRENLLSSESLNRIVADLQLGKADLSGVQQQTALDVVLELLTNTVPDTTDMMDATTSALRKSLLLEARPSDGTMEIRTTAATSEAARRIADYVAMRAVEGVGSGAILGEMRAMENARSGLDQAEAALTGFQMRLGNAVVSQLQNIQLKLQEADAVSSSLSQKEEELRGLIATTAAMKPKDVFGKTLPKTVVFLPLEDVRQNHATAELALAEILVDHGPRHPRTIAAQSAVDAARAAAIPALRSVLDGLKREERQLAESIAVNTQEKTVLAEALKGFGSAPVELLKLEAALEKARRDYLAVRELAPEASSEPAFRGLVSMKARPGVPSYDMFVSTTMTAAGALVGLLTSLFALSFRRKENLQQVIAIDEDMSDNIAPDPVHSDNVSHAIVEIEPDIFDDLQTPVLQAEMVVHDIEVQDVEENMDTPFDEPANDVPIDERVRQVLMRNAVRAEQEQGEAPVFKLPPLLAEALSGHAMHAQVESEKLRALRQELVMLRERLLEQAHQEDERNRA